MSYTEENVTLMNQLNGYNIVIVCCSTWKQCAYWKDRLDGGKGNLLAKDTTIICVEEDWPGGAGNGLGTLYAYTKAVAVAKENLKLDIGTELRNGNMSVAIFHTAGKGTRLAPLPAAENNNKPGVKLGATVKIGDKHKPITILESVIKQTGCYAPSRKGRLSVFWGDQVFIPSNTVKYNATHHVDILCSLGPMMSADEWREKGMEKYGLIVRSSSGKCAQVEKVDHATATSLLSDFGKIDAVGFSLGSFSVSTHLLDALLKEFDGEIEAKTGKLDTDPHFWMPMTLQKDSYLHLMQKKGICKEQSSQHFDRITAMMANFESNHPMPSGPLGVVDVGKALQWWDYGQLKLFQRNTLLLTKSSDEADLMRKFFGVEKEPIESMIDNVDVCENSFLSHSILSNSRKRKDPSNTGFVKNSVLINVHCNHIEAEDCVLINVTGDRIIAKKNSVIYNVVDIDGTLLNSVEEKCVYSGVFDENGDQKVLESTLDIDGGKVWDEKVLGNNCTFGEVNKLNANADPVKLEKIIESLHESQRCKLQLVTN